MRVLTAHGPCRREQGLRGTWLKALQGRPDHARPRRTWSSESAPPVWASRRRCTGSLEASRYSVELKTNMGSESCLVPGEGADRNHGHFHYLALFRLGSRKWEAESHPGGATRDEGEGGPSPSRGMPTTHALMPPTEGPLSEWWPSHPRRGQTGNCSATGEAAARTGRAPPGQSVPQVGTTPATTVPTSHAVLGRPGSTCPSEQTLSHVQDDRRPRSRHSEWFPSARDSRPPERPSTWSG